MPEGCDHSANPDVPNVSKMKIETFHIRSHVIRCEIYESELKIHRKDKKPIALLAFVLGSYSSDFLLELRGNLWVSVARRYLILKKEIVEKTHDDVIGRISFGCDDTHVEYEFSNLTNDCLRTLSLIVQFIRQYPISEKIRISREGPILVCFRNCSAADTS